MDKSERRREQEMGKEWKVKFKKKDGRVGGM